MSNRFIPCMKLFCAFIMLFAGGCVVKRTVKEDGVTVAQGYIVKRPLQN